MYLGFNPGIYDPRRLMMKEKFGQKKEEREARKFG